MSAGMERVDPLLDSLVSTFGAETEDQMLALIQIKIREIFRDTTPTCRSYSGCTGCGRDR